MTISGGQLEIGMGGVVYKYDEFLLSFLGYEGL